MPVPKAVEEQAKEADEMLKKLNEPSQEAENTDGGEETPADAPASDESAGQAQETVEGSKTAAEKPEAKPEAADPRDVELEKLKHSYSVLQGKYNAEVPRLYQRIKDLEGARESDASKKPEDAPQEPAPKNLATVIAKLKEDYGEDFAGSVQLLIREELGTAMKGVMTEVDKVKGTVAKTREEKFLEKLTEEVPNWQQIYNDPDFGNFLDQEDAYSGKTLRDLAVEANQSLDAKRLAKFYKAFNSSKQPVVKTETAPEEKPRDKREALITPAASGNQGSSTVGSEKPDRIKADDIHKFYSDVTRGIYAYRPKEKEALEERINRAIANGWVIE